jgi:sugar/nucleoside kinase (ribokinase family)
VSAVTGGSPPDAMGSIVRIPLRSDPRIKAFDIATVSLNSVDLLTVVGEFPTSNSKQRLQRFARMPGGQMATAMVVAARLGWTARYIGSFGADDFGAVSRESLEREGVDLTAARTVPGATNQFAVIIVDARTGERTVLWDRHPDLSMTPEEVPHDAVTSARMLIVDCHETAAATQAARYAREAGFRPSSTSERVRPGISSCSSTLTGSSQAQGFPAALHWLRRSGTRHRDDRARVRRPAGDRHPRRRGEPDVVRRSSDRTPGFKIDCVDSTGAGDVFQRRLASACLRAPSGEIEEALAYASATAALNCRALGARAGIPSAEEVERLLATPSRL